MGWRAAGQLSQPEPVCQQTALAQRAWHTLLRRSSPSRAAQGRLGRPSGLGAATNCAKGKTGGDLSPTPALPQRTKWSGQLASSWNCCWPGAFKKLVLVVLGWGVQVANTQKEQTAKGNVSIAWWRLEKMQQDRSAPNVIIHHNWHPRCPRRHHCVKASRRW